MKKQQDPSGYRTGDKVRIRGGEHAGSRGVILGETYGMLDVQLLTGEHVRLGVDDVTNYSLAARRAWEVMPKKAGRPKSDMPRKKMVSMRLDVDVWKMLGQAAEFGLIDSREQAVNDWLREKLMELAPKPTLDSQIEEVTR